MVVHGGPFPELGYLSSLYTLQEWLTLAALLDWRCTWQKLSDLAVAAPLFYNSNTEKCKQ